MSKDKQVIHKLKVISLISLAFMTVQILGGIMANSIAILADAFHLLSDVLAYVISLQAVLMSHKIPPFYMTFGYQKVQPLGALINVAIIWFVTLQLLVQATQRIINKSVVQDPLYMLLTSFFGLGCNLYIMKVLHSDVQHGGHQGCSHSHGLEHHNQHNHDHNHDHDHHQHKHNHKHGEKCSHGHGQVKAIKHTAHVHENGKKCSHGHHNQHDHKHTIKKQQKQHNHQHHDHDHDHDHNHQHGHDHSQHEHNHDHNHHHQHSQTCSHSKLSSQQSADSFREIDFSQSQQSKKPITLLNSQSPVTLTRQSMSQQIKLQQHISYKPQLPQLNVSDQNLRILQKQKARKQLFNNINIQAAYIHIISDIILSIGVIISAIIIYFNADRQQWTYWQLADPFCTYLFSVMAIYSTIGIAKDSIIILLDGCDDANMLKQIIIQLDSIQDIEQYKQLRVWSLNRSKFAAAVKIVLNKQKYYHMEKRNQIYHKIIGLFKNRGISYYVQIVQQQELEQNEKNMKMEKKIKNIVKLE